MKRILLLLSTLCLFQVSTNADYNSFYEANEITELDQGSKSDRQLVDFLKKVEGKHFRGLGYKKGSKPALFRTVDLKRDESGYYIKDVYCNIINRNVGPRKSPNNNVMNVEHTWPQSKGAKREPFRGDLHHLFPTDSRANSTRGNYPFGEVSGYDATSQCTSSQQGRIIDPATGKVTGQRGFQPPPEHRGNVARALFYAATFYGHKITPLEEYYLKKWHNEDPADEDEKARNDAIESLQGNRNPFIDFPGLVERISDF